MTFSPITPNENFYPNPVNKAIIDKQNIIVHHLLDSSLVLSRSYVSINTKSILAIKPPNIGMSAPCIIDIKIPMNILILGLLKSKSLLK